MAHISQAMSVDKHTPMNKSHGIDLLSAPTFHKYLCPVHGCTLWIIYIQIWIILNVICFPFLKILQWVFVDFFFCNIGNWTQDLHMIGNYSITELHSQFLNGKLDCVSSYVFRREALSRKLYLTASLEMLGVACAPERYSCFLLFILFFFSFLLLYPQKVNYWPWFIR